MLKMSRQELKNRFILSIGFERIALCILPSSLLFGAISTLCDEVDHYNPPTMYLCQMCKHF